MLLHNYHTHTTRCHHAVGQDREYVEAAIQAGIKTLGFSDHAPHVCKNGQEGSFRVPMAKAQDYVNDLAALRNKYADKIDIKIGFEMEYYPERFDEMLDTVKKIGAEYLILGEHFMHDELPNGVHATRGGDSIEILDDYVYCVTSAIKSGAFSYVCHPDIANFTGDDEVYISEVKRISEAAIEFDTPLEINFLGIRKSKNYPRELFWRTVGEVGAPVVFGCDAHTPEDAYDAVSLVTAQTLVEKYHLNYIGKPKIRPLL
jgi:histidinol-phosphatase (PHP family)